MNPETRAAIDLVESAYDLQACAEDWLPGLLRAGRGVLDHGLGCAAAIWAGASDEGEPLITQMCVDSADRDLGVRFARAAQEVGPELQEQTRAARSGGVRVLSDCKGPRPVIHSALTRHVGCEDILGIWAVDQELHGVGINMPSPHRIDLHPKIRGRWQMLAVHIQTGYRLRRQFGRTVDQPRTPATEIPAQAEAVLDPTRFAVVEAKGDAKRPDVRQQIRNAVVRQDRARARLGERDADEALRMWKDLVRGKWSLVDWFDRDGRRFVVAIPNAPNAADPRGLSEREYQVAMSAALGESRKVTAYRLGLSQSYVSAILSRAMQKLRVKTQAQLVARMRALPASTDR